MGDKLAGQVLDLLKQVGDTISGGAKEAFAIYTRQAYMEGMVGVAGGIVVIALVCVLIPLFIRRLNHTLTLDDSPWEHGEIDALTVTYGAASGILLVALLLSLSNPTFIMQIINPQYYAIERLLEHLPR